MASDTIPVESLIDYLGTLLERNFSDSVSNVYFGDVGMLPPRAFQDERGENRAVIVIEAQGESDPTHRSSAEDIRTVTLDIKVMVNIIPYFNAFPSEAFGERILIRTATKVKQFLSQSEFRTLYGRVNDARIGAIRYDTGVRGPNLVTREAILEFKAQISDKKM